MNMQYENSSKLRSLKLNRRNSAVLAVMLFALAAVALPAAAETINPADPESFLADGKDNDGLNSSPSSFSSLDTFQWVQRSFLHERALKRRTRNTAQP